MDLIAFRADFARGVVAADRNMRAMRDLTRSNNALIDQTREMLRQYAVEIGSKEP